MPVNVIIRVRPARALRVEFARWAVAQVPPVRTVSTTEFGVPAHLFPAIPEALLTGALVDGRSYVVPGPAVPWEGDSRGQAPPPAAGGGTELVVERKRDVEAGPSPELEPVPVVQPAPAPEAAAAEGYPCGLCPRSFPSERGASAHRRQAHTDTEG